MDQPRASLFAVALLVSAIVSAPAHASQLFVDAPAACVDPAGLTEEVSELVGKPLAEVADVDFRIRIAEGAPGKWRLHLEMIDKAAPVGGAPAIRGSREIDGTSCDELAEAASVAIAVSIRSIAAAPTTPDAPASPPMISTPPISHPSVPAAPPGTALHPAVALALTTDSGALPSISPGVELEGSLARGALRLTALAAWFASRDVYGQGGGGGTFQLVLGGALGCLAPHWGRWMPLACGGVELGRLAGTGLGVARPTTGQTLWRAARIDVGATAALVDHLAAVLRAGMVVPLAHPSFVLDGSELVYRPSRLGFRLTAGLELGF